jgi:hypothetical protein
MQMPSANSGTGSYQWVDPRQRPDFQPDHYPKVDGHEAPPGNAPERNDRIKAEFCAVYYDLNRLYARLLNARKTLTGATGKAAEREIIQAIEKVLIGRDALEDRFAPLGVIAEPVVEGGFTKDLRCSFGDVDATGQRRSELFTITTYAPLPLPVNLRFEDLPLKVEGPGFSR